jgi:hypothetical protein
MRSKNMLLSILFLTQIGIPLLAQQSILSLTGNASGTGGSVSYSVGQVAYIHYAGMSGAGTEGVQQPYEIQIPEGIDQEAGINLECILFPNPADAFIRLKIDNPETRLLTFQLLDINGTLLRNDKIEYAETTIPMDNLTPATYFITVSEKGKLVKTFKVIKK